MYFLVLITLQKSLSSRIHSKVKLQEILVIKTARVHKTLVLKDLETLQNELLISLFFIFSTNFKLTGCDFSQNKEKNIIGMKNWYRAANFASEKFFKAHVYND